MGCVLSNGKGSANEIDQNIGLANAIHERRLAGLYVDPDREDWAHPRDYITPDEAGNILTIAEARLGMEESVEIDFSLDPVVADNARWFSDPSDDPEKRRLIFGGPSVLVDQAPTGSRDKERPPRADDLAEESRRRRG